MVSANTAITKRMREGKFYCQFYQANQVNLRITSNYIITLSLFIPKNLSQNLAVWEKLHPMFQ